MKITKEQARKLNSFSYDPLFMDKSKEILKDFLYSSLACSLIQLSTYEVDVLLTYYANSISKRKATKLIEDSNNENFIMDFDSYLFYAKNLKDVYKFSDGIFLDDKKIKQKKLYLLLHRYQEVLDVDILNDLYFLKSVIGNKKVLYIYYKNEKHDILPFKNLITLEIDKNEAKEYASNQEWFDIIKMRVMILNFDIAFINIGLFSNLLNYFIAQSLNKIAITKRKELKK